MRSTRISLAITALALAASLALAQTVPQETPAAALGAGPRVAQTRAPMVAAVVATPTSPEAASPEALPAPEAEPAAASQPVE